MKFAKVAVAIAIMCSASATAQVTSNFGTRTDPIKGGKAMHSGIDIAARTGTPVYATADGYVGRSQWAGGYGNLVEVNHANGFQTRFGHLHQRAVASGQYVRRGMLIGWIGSTGRSTGPHLHYEVRINGRAVDPRPYMKAPAHTIRSHAVAMGGPAR